MKKNYIVPETITVQIKASSLLVQYSNSQAASDATSLSRGERGGDRGSDWDDDEE